MDNLIECPHCKSKNVKKSISGHATNAITNIVAYGIGYTANTLISSILPFDTHGTGTIAKGVKSFVPLEYECKDCDCLFSVQFDSDQKIDSIKVKKLPIPLDIIQKEKDAYIAERKSSISYTRAVSCGFISFVLFVYCCIADSSHQVWREAGWFHDAGYVTEVYDSYAFCAGQCATFGVIAIIAYLFTANKKKKIKAEENMSLKDFKAKHPDIFAKYPQYN